MSTTPYSVHRTSQTCTDVIPDNVTGESPTKSCDDDNPSCDDDNPYFELEYHASDDSDGDGDIAHNKVTDDDANDDGDDDKDDTDGDDNEPVYDDPEFIGYASQDGYYGDEDDKEEHEEDNGDDGDDGFISDVPSEQVPIEGEEDEESVYETVVSS